MKTFKSDISLGIFVILMVLLGASFLITLSSNSGLLSMVVFFVQLSSIILVLNIFLQTDYTISNEGKLFIRCGVFYKTNINISDIHSVEQTSELTSAPALSFDRLEIKYGNNKSIIISPKDKRGFIEKLLMIQPTIQY